MKNFSKKIATIAATLALVVVLGLTLTACGSKSSDDAKALTMEEYAANLEKANYKFQKITSEDDDWAEWVGNIYDDYTDKDSESYNAELAATQENMQWMIMGFGEKDGDGIYIFGFSDNANAKTFGECYTKIYEAEKDENDDDMYFQVVGNVAIGATSQTLIDAANGKVVAEASEEAAA